MQKSWKKYKKQAKKTNIGVTLVGGKSRCEKNLKNHEKQRKKRKEQ
jgi:hypothetical protein